MGADRFFPDSPTGRGSGWLGLMSKSKPAGKAASADVEAEVIKIRAEPIELAQLLKFAGVFDSGGEAKHAIQNGEVTVNGAVETAVRKKIVAGTTVACADRVLVVRVFR